MGGRDEGGVPWSVRLIWAYLGLMGCTLLLNCEYSGRLTSWEQWIIEFTVFIGDLRCQGEGGRVGARGVLAGVGISWYFAVFRWNMGLVWHWVMNVWYYLSVVIRNWARECDLLVDSCVNDNLGIFPCLGIFCWWWNTLTYDDTMFFLVYEVVITWKNVLL